jgi:acyl transferase domain-containing protein
MSESRQEGIAIIGMAGRFPGADSVEEFWENLTAGRESITFFADEELAASGLDVAALKRAGNYVPARGVLKDADCFDAAFFGIHQKEAEVMDPQQRVFLEGCWEALERAGYAPGQIDHSVGVYAGATFNTYYLHALHHRRDLVELAGQQQVMLGNEKDYIATRVAYKLNLKGPAVSLNTACSSSLVAVCQACQALLTYQCDMALAGGISVTVPQKRGYYYQEGNINSPDGHTRTFDEKAEGTVFSSGMGIVVLKRLEEALEDGDQIYAVIKAATLNNDGSQRVSFVAPGVDGQADVIALAHALAGINPETITYVEAHGTATPIGDPIELAALTKAFRARTQRKQFCAIGSVKSNIGHLDAASGVAGLIKTALALRHGLLPASLHFKKPNPRLELENSPFIVCETTQPWNSGYVPRRAGVSSFGLGGTNAHVVLEEAPEIPPSDPSRPWQLLPLSAKTPLALEAATRNLTAWFKERPRMSLADAAFTLQVGRSEFAHRRFVVSRDPQDAAQVLEAQDPKRVFAGERRTQEPQVVFMFPGQGVQYASMGAELYRIEPVFRAVVDQCSELLEPLLGLDLRHCLYPAKGQESVAQEMLAQTRVTQPALFVTEYALAKLWMSWGVRPAAMIGHSVGEYVAACLAGVLPLEQAVQLVAQRAQLVQDLPRGAMLAVRLCEKEVVALLDGQLSIAAVNSPGLCVVSGPYEAVSALEKVLKGKGIVGRRLHTSHAFHSAMMDPVIEPFRELVRKNPLSPPQVRYVSNVTGRWVTAEESMSPDYWAAHLRQCVRFADGVGELTKDPENILLEVGPGQTLATLARQHPNRSTKQLVVSSLQNKDEEARSLLETLGHLWTAGVRIDWGASIPASVVSGWSCQPIRLTKSAIGQNPMRPPRPSLRPRHWPFRRLPRLPRVTRSVQQSAKTLPFGIKPFRESIT